MNSSNTPIVVLLHALGRGRLSLVSAERYLRRAGFEPLSVPYPSTRQPVQELAAFVAAQLPEIPGRPMHFLTHSMGGIVLRCLAQTHRPPNLSRAVMLGPPNRGSQLASRLKRNWIFRRALGPAGQEIGAEPDSLPNQLGPVDFELGVVAGRTVFDPFALLISGVSDGKVSLDETRVQGAVDWMVVRRAHALLINDSKVLAQAVHFFQHGRFSR